MKLTSILRIIQLAFLLVLLSLLGANLLDQTDFARAQSIPTATPTAEPWPTPIGLPPAEMYARRYRSAAAPLPEEGSLRWRMGVGVPSIGPLPFLWPEPRPGWYISWSVNMIGSPRPFPDPATIDMDAEPYRQLGMEFVPVVKLFNGRLYFETEVLTDLAARNPGRTWLVGNEPDVVWQDNSTAPDYARAYHDAYQAIKRGDATAKIAMGGLSQITPLRLTYLSRVWASYASTYGETMPVDVWTMHAYVLREEAGSWGVAIPPGFESITRGVLWEVEDHGDLQLVENQVRLMRSWMARNGQKEKPLWITEYGILLPEEFGYDQVTIQRFMLNSFELFQSLRDTRLGLSSDDHRLVQRWNWFSTYYEPFPSSDLFDKDGLPTPLMEIFSAYLSEATTAEE